MILQMYIMLVIAGMLFLFFSLARLKNEFYFDTISAFLSSVIFFIVGFGAFEGIESGTKIMQYPTIGMLFIVIGVLGALVGVIHIFDIAMEEFGYGEDETTRDADYEYK